VTDRPTSRRRHLSAVDADGEETAGWSAVPAERTGTDGVGVADLRGPAPKGPPRLAALAAGRPARLHRFFEAACDAWPDAVAVECGPDRLTYGELDEAANRLAHHLLRARLGRGAKVGILLHRSAETYVALLGVLKAGGAFVPIDATWPPERAAFVAADAGLSAVLTSAACRGTTSGMSCPVLVLDVAALSAVTEPVPASRLGLGDDGDALCYVIYTSGSTGRPKGVQIAQSSICNFIDVVGGLYGVRRGDRVYQGMTIAFDFSIEEIWPTWAVGATLVAGPTDDRRLGRGLGQFLTDAAVSVLYCVPTLLATLDEDVPTVRTLVVGGEACPGELVERWSRPGRRILNTYGPTEATVTATCGELVAGRPVTIGRPLPTYRVYLLDDSLRRVPDGRVGEICIGGPGVARGYVGRPELTASRFPADPFTGNGNGIGARLYRTGDLGRVLPDGEIEYLGRSDSEVKVRGHRVDLQEIERVLLEDEAVGAAVAALLPAAGPAGELTAYVTRRAPDGGDRALVGRLRERLRRRVPPYMVPAFLEVLPALPTLASGKVDRGHLPPPSGGRLRATDRPRVPASTPIEVELAAVWAEVFAVGAEDVSVEDDFFLDLGGHSLLAAGAVSTLRRRQVGRNLAIGDLYAHPTIAGLARLLAGERAAEGGLAVPAGAAARAARPPTSRVQVALCGLAQGTLLAVLLLVVGAPVAVVLHLNHGRLLTAATLTQLAVVAALTGLVGGAVLPLLAARLVSRGLRPGRYPLWGRTYLQLWTVQRLLAVAPVGLLSGSPALPAYLRLLGMRVGRGCHITTAAVGLPALTEIGAGVTIGYGAQLHNSVVADGWVTIGRVVVGAEAFIGANAVLLPGTRLGAGSQLAEQSLAAQDQTIPAGERWAGSPSQLCPDPDPLLETMGGQPARADWPPRLLFGFGVGLLGLMLLGAIALAPAGTLVFAAAMILGPGYGVAATVPAGPLFVATTCLVVVGGKRLVLRSSPPGIHPLRTGLGVRKWLADQLMNASLAATNSLYATLYTIPLIRALGARVGSWAEVSTVAHLDPDLLTLGPESFVADLASLGSARYHHGNVALAPTTVGRRSFVGNAAVVPAGTELGDGSLIGVHTTPPAPRRAGRVVLARIASDLPAPAAGEPVLR
jgi:amino acid adenylation domain-containing protein